MNIVDRRLNPQGKSLENRQRFLRRAKEQVARAVGDASAQQGIQDIGKDGSVSIPAKGLGEPAFQRRRDVGTHDQVMPGNKEFNEGDHLPRPAGSGGKGGGSEGSPDGDGNDDFRFVLSRDEFLDIFLNDLELPNLVKEKLKSSESLSRVRAGFSVSGSPTSINILRTMKHSRMRRIALKRPKPEDIEALKREIESLEQSGDNPGKLKAHKELLDRWERKLKTVPFIDPFDVRYNRFESVPRPIAQAVMFCLMDVSGSMTEHMKNLAKNFFQLLRLFLTTRYRSVEVVFIRHTHEAKEVDEETFFYSTETGGTIVSTALTEMLRVVQERYDVNDWNIYVAQASDGDNAPGDNDGVKRLLLGDVLPICQYFAYLEVGSELSPKTLTLPKDTDLWRLYLTIKSDRLPFAMQKARHKREIFPALRALFPPNASNSRRSA